MGRSNVFKFEFKFYYGFDFGVGTDFIARIRFFKMPWPILDWTEPKGELLHRLAAWYHNFLWRTNCADMLDTHKKILRLSLLLFLLFASLTGGSAPSHLQFWFNYISHFNALHGSVPTPFGQTMANVIEPEFPIATPKKKEFYRPYGSTSNRSYAVFKKLMIFKSSEFYRFIQCVACYGTPIEFKK